MSCIVNISCRIDLIKFGWGIKQKAFSLEFEIRLCGLQLNRLLD